MVPPKHDEAIERPAVPLVRVVLAILAVAAAGALGALVLGEYEFKGWMPWIAGPLLGLILGEVASAVARARHLALAIATGVCAAGAIWWAGWISSGSGLEPVPWQVYAAALLAAATGAFRTAPPVASARAGVTDPATGEVEDHNLS